MIQTVSWFQSVWHSLHHAFKLHLSGFLYNSSWWSGLSHRKTQMCNLLRLKYISNMLQKLPDLDFTSLQHLHHHQNTPTYYFGSHFSICLWVQIAQAVNYLSQPDQYRVAEIHVPVWYKLVNGDVQKAICTDTFTKCQFTFLKPFRYSSIANIAFEVLSSEDFKFRYFEFTLQKKDTVHTAHSVNSFRYLHIDH